MYSHFDEKFAGMPFDHVDLKNQFRDPTQTYLESPWTLWLVNKQNAQTKTWLECLHPIATFSTIQQFWGMYNSLKPPSELPVHWEYALFRGGLGRRVIVPDWDDHENSGGGCMQLTGFNLEPKTIDHLWRDICLKAIEEAWIHTSDYINGTIVSTKSGTTRFYVWIAPCKEHIWETVRERIESVFSQDCRTPLKWTPHMERKTMDPAKEAPKEKAKANVTVAKTQEIKLPRHFRSRSVAYRKDRTLEEQATEDFLQLKRNGPQPPAAEPRVEVPLMEAMQPQLQPASAKKPYMLPPLKEVSGPPVRASVSFNLPYSGQRRGRSCHGTKAYNEFPLFNGPRDHSRCRGGGDINTASCRLCTQQVQHQHVRTGRSIIANSKPSKEMVDVSTQFTQCGGMPMEFNSKTRPSSSMMAGGDAGGGDYVADLGDMVHEHLVKNEQYE